MSAHTVTSQLDRRCKVPITQNAGYPAVVLFQTLQVDFMNHQIIYPEDEVYLQDAEAEEYLPVSLQW